jgi:hypothetical protein
MKKTSSETRRRVLAGATLALGVAMALAPCRLASAQQRSAADIAQARDLFNEGTSLRDKGDTAGALEKLRAAHALAATPITGLELGRTYIAAGKLVEAREVLLGVGRIPVSPQETARSAAARTTAAQLAEQVRPRIARLGVHVTGAALDAVTVSIDGATVASDALAAPRPVNPGKHQVVAVPSSGARAEATVDIKEGESRDVELHVTLAPSAGATAQDASSAQPGPAGQAGPSGEPARGKELPNEPPAAAPRSGGRVLVWTGFGLAAAGVAAGAVTGILAMSKSSSVNDACHNTLDCPRTVDSDLQTGRTMGTISTIAFAAAGGGAVLGVVALLVGRKNETPPAATAWVTPWVAPGAGGLSGALRF